ncbi:MAG: MG2 domain-containing protein [Acidobacteriota bacterium]
MRRQFRWSFLFSALMQLSCAGLFAADDGLSVVQAGPEGEISQLEEANEIRVRFSEPMVALGRIPETVTAPYFKVTPFIKGAFRWSGTSQLIFTPDHQTPLPYCTKYTVTVDTSAESIDGSRLAKPYEFSFTTPTVRLLRSGWHRKSARYDSPAIFAFRFNQQVSAKAVISHLKLRYNSYKWTAPEFQKEVMARLPNEAPDAFVDFQKKVAETTMVTQSTAPVAFSIASDWDKVTYPPGSDLVVVQTSVAPPPQAQIVAEFDAQLPGVEGKETPATKQSYLFKMEPAFFVKHLECSAQCSVEFYNAICFKGTVSVDDVRSKLGVRDVTDPQNETRVPSTVKKTEEEEEEEGGYWEDDEEITTSVSFDRLGLQVKPARTYLFRIEKDLTAADGQKLGYTWYGQVEYWHKSAFTSFGTGHGVWESSGGPQLPFYARNLTRISEWIAAVKPEELVPTILKIDGWQLKPDGTPERSGQSNMPPPVEPVVRRLKPERDTIQSFGLNLARFLSPSGTGLAWAAIQGRDAIPRSYRIEHDPNATLVQVTNLGISVKDSPQNTLIMVTRLDDGMPVEGAQVEIRTLDNRVFWSGVTGADGVVVAPDTDMRAGLKLDRWEIPWTLAFVVTARKGEDYAYACSDWNDGIRSWDFGIGYNPDEAKPLLRGTVFADRGVYKLGEEVHLKAILRSDTVTGIKFIPPDAKLNLVLRDSEGEDVSKQTTLLSEWGTTDWVWRLPTDGPLGPYTVEAEVSGQQGSVYGNFLVAAYRRPDFRVDANLGGADDIAGAALKGVITGRYLFGAPMAERDVRITYYKVPVGNVPQAVTDRFPAERYAYLLEAWQSSPPSETQTILTKEDKLGPDGSISLDLETELKAGYPYQYTLEGEVTDVSRQTIAGSAGFVVHPAPWYLALKRPSFFVDSKDGLHSEILAVTPRGDAVPGVKVTATLNQVQWNSVRHAEGGGFYWWESQRVEKERWTGEVTTAGQPVPIDVPLEDGGLFVLEVTASDPDGRNTTTNTDFYVLGAGYTAWERYDHNRIDLVPEKKSYKPGETARIMIKSPWEKATALLTTEREGIRTHKEFQLTSTQQTVEVPITEGEIPNVYVSVLLIKGRTSTTIEKDGSDPGKPAFRLGYTALKVDSGRKRLSVEVRTDKEEYRPAENAKISVQVKDVDGKPAVCEVTLWAVDYGVLSLTGYKTPDILDSIYVQKALQVMNADSRQCIVSRRVITPKGAEEGGGGGYEEGPESKIRKDFRVLAFWLGSLVTDDNGRASTTQKLPESLTTYRIMAVVHDKASRCGWGEREIRLSKPVMLTPAFPRFLALGDKAYFGSVVHSLLKDPGKAIVTMKSLDPSVLKLTGDSSQTVTVAAKGSAEVRFDVEVKSVGTARILMSVKLLGEEDAFELALPVRLLSSPEVMAAYGIAAPDAHEMLELPSGVVPSFGGLHLEMASTAMVGLGEGARYLVDYPYGCAEQRASCAVALLLTADLGNAFRLPDIKPDELKEITQATLKDLEEFQCQDGGFWYWKGGCPWSSPYLTSYILWVYQRAAKLGYSVSQPVVDRAYAFLESQLGTPPVTNEAYWPGYTAWQAFATKVLAEGGKTVDSHITRLYGYKDRMPIFGLCYLWDAMAASGEKGQRPDDIRRRVMNAILMEAGASHVEELTDPYLLWYWNSNVRSTAIALESLVRNSTPDSNVIAGIVRWLMQVRKKGRWGNTQENAWAMDALVEYYKKYEAEIPDFTALAALGTRTIMTETFKGRTTEARSSDMPMEKLLTRGRAGERLPLTFSRQGTGSLFYTARLKYASAEPMLNPMDVGFQVRRSYAPREGGAATQTFKAGELVEVTLTFELTKERRWVAVTDPIPAGFEPVESWFATTAADLARDQREEESGGTWVQFWQKGGFDHVERHDDRVLLFATRLSEGQHTFRYVCRATTAGTFVTAPTHVEEMYSPEVFGRTASDVVEVKP